jgi:hypothetical protein
MDISHPPKKEKPGAALALLPYIKLIMPTLGAVKKCFTFLLWPQQFFLQIDKIKKNCCGQAVCKHFLTARQQKQKKTTLPIKLRVVFLFCCSPGFSFFWRGVVLVCRAAGGIYRVS